MAPTSRKRRLLLAALLMTALLVALAVGFLGYRAVFP
jgi:hypothetical protein